METTSICIVRKTLFTLLLNGTEIISFKSEAEGRASYATAVAIDGGCHWQLVLTVTPCKVKVNTITDKVISEEDKKPIKIVLLDTEETID